MHACVYPYYAVFCFVLFDRWALFLCVVALFRFVVLLSKFSYLFVYIFTIFLHFVFIFLLIDYF